MCHIYNKAYRLSFATLRWEGVETAHRSRQKSIPISGPMR
jgi:hypothetical protein